MQLTFEKIKNELAAGKISPAYFLYGDEDFLIEELIDQIIAVTVDQETRDFNLDVVYGDEVDGSKIVSLARSFPMMANLRTVVVKGIHNFSQQSLGLITKYLERPSPTTCLVMTAPRVDFRKKHFSKIRDHCVSFEAKPLYENQIPDWIRGYLTAQGIAIGDEAIRLLQVSAGNSLRSIVGEIEKILINISGRTQIEVADVEFVVGVSKNYNIFELCDAVGRQEIGKSLHILNKMLQYGESPTTIVAMLTRHFVILSKLKRMVAQRLPREKMAMEVGINPFFVQNYLQQAQRYSMTNLNNVFQHLLDADIKLKSSLQKPQMVLEILLFTFLNEQAGKTTELAV